MFACVYEEVREKVYVSGLCERVGGRAGALVGTCIAGAWLLQPVALVAGLDERG